MSLHASSPGILNKDVTLNSLNCLVIIFMFRYSLQKQHPRQRFTFFTTIHVIYVYCLCLLPVESNVEQMIDLVNTDN